MPTQKNSPEDSKRVGIWIRVSTEEQVRGESPEHHERRARLYAEAKGWNVIEVYRLDATSGKTVKELPETKRMLADTKSGHITGLIFSKLARLARNTKELLEFAELFREYDADLISLAESIDTSTPAGRLFYTMIAAMAQWEREEIASRVAASVPIRAKMGKSLGGQLPFGYHWVNKVVCPHPEEAPIRKLMYELFSKHKRKKMVARILNERGYRTRNGSPFSDTTIDRLIRDPLSKGVRRINYTKSTNNKKAWEFKPESEWVHHDVEAIVSEELWNECNAFLDTQRTKGKRITKQVVHLFIGVTYCGCGERMYVPSNMPKYVCRTCRTKIPMVDLEGVFHEQIKNFFFSPQEIALHLRKANATIHEKEEILEVLLKEQKKLAASVDMLHDLYQSGAVDKAGFGAKYHPMAARQRQLEDEVPQVQAELDVLKISHLSQEEIITGARDLYTRWPELPQEEKRRIVEAITDRIIISNDEVEINLFYAPPSSIPPVGTPFTPKTPGSSSPPSTPSLNGGGRATHQHRYGCRAHLLGAGRHQEPIP
jgi:site-specific DNA recombinase